MYVSGTVKARPLATGLRCLGGSQPSGSIAFPSFSSGVPYVTHRFVTGGSESTEG